MRQVYRFIVRGRVQGVHFRQSARQQALRLGLRGWVRNLTNGDVAGAAAGEPGALEGFRDWLQRGPSQAIVESLDWEAIGAEALDDLPAGFAVLRGDAD